MAAILDSISSGSVGNASSLSWTHTILNPSGARGAIYVAAIGREQTGDQDPEHITSITFNGTSMTSVQNTGSEQTAGCLYVLTGTSVPGVGNYTVTVNYQGSGTAEYHRGVCAVFRSVKNQATEATNSFTSSFSTGRQQVSTNTLTNNALVIGVHWWRVGFAETQYSDFTHLITDRGDNAAGVSMWYKTKTTPGLVTLDLDGGNTESHGLYIASFAIHPPPVPGGIL